MLRRGSILLCLTGLLGCPAPEPTVARRADVEPAKPDPRIAEMNGDLYNAEDLRRNLSSARAGQDAPKPGSGKPDETNGVCRLYSPKLPEPECCAVEYGFDAAEARRICDFPVYLGESFHYSCGYYFHQRKGTPAWFRMTFVPGSSPAEAAASHDRHLARLSPTGRAPQPSQPVPGVEGAYWSFHDGLAWAFVPGWSRVRQLTWRESFCDRDKVAKIIASLAAAKEPAKGARRESLVPTARR